MKSRILKRLAVVMALVVVQALLFVFAYILDLFSDQNQLRDCFGRGLPGIFMFSSLCVSIIGGALILKACKDIESQTLTAMEIAELQKSREMIKLLRSQRHEFGNHLQVICGLIQLNNNSKALDYIHSVAQDFIKPGSAFVVDESPVINALLLTKLTQAQKSGIKFCVDLQADLEKINLPQYKVGKVLVNIINNAIDAVSELQDGERRIEVKVFQTPTHILFNVWNNGSYIEPLLLEKIFEPGYTTKGEKGQGLGLYIVKALLQEMKGDIQVESTMQGGTTFTVSFPLQKGYAPVVSQEKTKSMQGILEDANIESIGGQV